MSLTDTAIKRLQPSDKCTPNRPDKYTDGNGLELWVRHTGNKVWYVDYTYQGKRKELAIGKYPALSLAQARQKTLEIKSQLVQGIDPKAVAKLAKIEQADTRFDVFAQKWLAHQQTRIKEHTFKRANPPTPRTFCLYWAKRTFTPFACLILSPFPTAWQHRAKRA